MWHNEYICTCIYMVSRITLTISVYAYNLEDKGHGQIYFKPVKIYLMALNANSSFTSVLMERVHI